MGEIINKLNNLRNYGILQIFVHVFGGKNVARFTSICGIFIRRELNKNSLCNYIEIALEKYQKYRKIYVLTKFLGNEIGRKNNFCY